jgi:toluene monooxygenase system protein D|tara:strand:+ start:8908 stop:9222 length:315 start_codon:yes stop_codon:yes gene_type:complete
MSDSDLKNAYKQNKVGPILNGGDVAQAAIDAAEWDNPDKEITVDDKGAYVRIAAEGELIITRASMEEALGRHFEMREIEIHLGSMAGQIEVTPEQIRFYFEKTL